MSKDSITKRFAQYKKLEEEQERQHRLERQADESGPALFRAVRDAVAADVQECNRQFADVRGAQCTFHEVGNDWEVRRDGKGTLQAIRRGSTLLEFEVDMSPAGAFPKKVGAQGHITVKPNFTTGGIEFEYKDKRLGDPADVADLLLDYILPGENDFTRQ